MVRKPGKMYRNISKKAYTRREYMGGVPGSKVVQFDMGNLSGEFPMEVSLAVEEACQIRHTALEAPCVPASRTSREQAGNRSRGRPCIRGDAALVWEGSRDCRTSRTWTGDIHRLYHSPVPSPGEDRTQVGRPQTSLPLVHQHIREDCSRVPCTPAGINPFFGYLPQVFSPLSMPVLAVQSKRSPIQVPAR